MTTIPIIIRDARKNYSAFEKERMMEVLERFIGARTRKAFIRQAVMRITVAKTPCQHDRAVVVTLAVSLTSGAKLIASAEAREALLAFRGALKEIKTELSRLHDQWVTHRTRARSFAKKEQ